MAIKREREIAMAILVKGFAIEVLIIANKNKLLHNRDKAIRRFRENAIKRERGNRGKIFSLRRGSALWKINLMN
jgi:hypothetical protein